MEQLSANRSSRLVMIDQSQAWSSPFFCSTHHMLKTVWKEICFSMGPQQGACFRKLNSPEEKTENVSTCRWLNFVMENQFQTIREKHSWNLTNHSSQNRQATIFFITTSHSMESWYMVFQKKRWFIVVLQNWIMNSQCQLSFRSTKIMIVFK